MGADTTAVKKKDEIISMSRMALTGSRGDKE